MEEIVVRLVIRFQIVIGFGFAVRCRNGKRLMSGSFFNHRTIRVIELSQKFHNLLKRLID